jgi:hypothetical protein
MGEEEWLVLEDGAAAIATELVDDVLRIVRAVVKEVAGLQSAIGVVLPGRSVELVRTGFDDGVDRGSCGIVLLGIEAIGNDADRLYGVGRRNVSRDVRLPGVDVAAAGGLKPGIVTKTLSKLRLPLVPAVGRSVIS